MEKNKIIICILLPSAALIFAFFAICCGVNKDYQKQEEVIPENVIVCRCAKSIFANNRCNVRNDGEICAMSEPHGNIICADYATNCKRTKRILKNIKEKFSSEKNPKQKNNVL